MPIDAARLPHGVKLPVGLTADVAIDLIKAIADHYGHAHVLFTPDQIEDQLVANLAAVPDRQRRRLTTDERQRLQATVAWQHLMDAAHAVTTGQISDAIRQASLECRRCTASLTGPPTATWGHCPTCLIDADLDELRQLPCAAAGADVSHRWDHTACTNCGLPRTNTKARPLTAITTA